MVGELHRRMDDALPLDNDLDLVFRQAEQPHRLDQFQALVHQGGRVDGDLGAHIPVGMLEGVSLGLAPELFGGHPIERSTGCREQNFFQPFRRGGILQALENGRMLAVHRQKVHPLAADRIGDQMAAGDQAFLVGKGQVMPRLNGSQRSRKAGNSHNRVEYHSGAVHGSELTQPLGALEQLGCIRLPRQHGIQPGKGIRVHHCNIRRVELGNLFGQQIHAPVGRQTENAVTVHPGHIQALGADGAGGTQQCDGFDRILGHGFPSFPGLHT